jgi:hypothetical protein
VKRLFSESLDSLHVSPSPITTNENDSDNRSELDQ